jgi:hypothetical protein
LGQLTGPSFTQANLDALNEAIADGALRVKYTDKEIEYRSLDELLKIRELMMRDLGQVKSCSGSRGLFGGRRVVVRHDKDL